MTGIIKAFNAINAGGAGDPRMLSGGIAEALVATAAGLCVAIPSLIAYRYLRGRVDRIVVEMEKNALRLADAVEAAARRADLPEALLHRQPAPHAAVGERRRDEPRWLDMNLKPRRNEEPEINVTSLIDVVLLLVVFFMLVVELRGRRAAAYSSACGQFGPNRAAQAASRWWLRSRPGGSLSGQWTRTHQLQRRYAARGDSEERGRGRARPAGAPFVPTAARAISRWSPRWTCSPASGSVR